jgi:ABC-2 type transport system permease protein/lipopolysaccharide transport system permease protein
MVGITLIVIAKSFLFSGILNVPSERIIPNLAIGMLVWRLLAGIVNGSCNAISSNKANFEQGYFPLFTPVLSTIVYHGFVFLHAFMPMVVISFYFVLPDISDILFLFPGLVVIIFAGIPVGYIISILCTRYRDLTNLIHALMGILFFLTPVIWVPEMVSGFRQWVLYLNPFYHFIELVRDPLVNQPIELLNWVVAIMIGMFAWFVSYLLYAFYGRKVLIWL